MFHQTFDPHDLIVIGVLVVLEGVLSIDNALVLGLLARRLPKKLQGRALTYGLIGAFVFRIIAIATASFLLRWGFVKLLGGAYLVYVAMKHFFFESKEEAQENIVLGADGRPILMDAHAGDPLSEARSDSEIRQRAAPPIAPAHASAATSTHTRAFWETVVVIELTDIAFAVDSIVAAIGVVGAAPAGSPEGSTHPKLWVVLIGGMIGVVLMRFAAVVFIKLLERFPRFEMSAYLLVMVIGLKLVADWLFNTPERARLDFHHPGSVAFWVFWVLMLVCFIIGFVPPKKHSIRQ